MRVAPDVAVPEVEAVGCTVGDGVTEKEAERVCRSVAGFVAVPLGEPLAEGKGVRAAVPVWLVVVDACGVADIEELRVGDGWSEGVAKGVAEALGVLVGVASDGLREEVGVGDGVEVGQSRLWPRTVMLNPGAGV